jgi:hypothetical protein
MQDRYVGDVGDFAKLLLLRRLVVGCGDSLPHPRLGIVWYRCNPGEVDGKKASKDGDRTEYLLQNGGGPFSPDDVVRLQKADLDLYRLLRRLVYEDRTRAVPALEAGLTASGCLPATSRFFNTMLSLRGTASEKWRQRCEWFRAAVQAVADSDLVFLDPDDGLPRPSRSPTHKPGPKSTFFHEVAAFLLREKSVVIIQYPAREHHDDRHERYIDPLTLYCSTRSKPSVLRFRVVKHPWFILIPRPAHADVLVSRWNKVASDFPELYEELPVRC